MTAASHPHPAVRFDLLDGLRGAAAIAVMVHHVSRPSGLNWLPGAWVAVDLFFILSGFVIAYSYSEKIKQGLSFRQFSLIRLIRLGPLYLLSLLIGLWVATTVPLGADELHLTGAERMTSFVLGLAWLPYFHVWPWPVGPGSGFFPLFPLNDSAWSLFFELIVNIGFFWYLVRHGRSPGIQQVVMWFLLFLVLTLIFKKSNPGWGTTNFFLGFPRVIYEFFAGVLIYSLHLYKKTPPKPLIFLVALLAFFLFSVGNTLVCLANAVIFIPLTVVLMSTARVQGIATYVMKFLGEISYPLYVLHLPLYRLLMDFDEIKTLNAVPQTLVICLFCLCAAAMLWPVDMRLRKALMARVLPPRNLPSAVSG